jgi:hypothetical protein
MIAFSLEEGTERKEGNTAKLAKREGRGLCWFGIVFIKGI